MPDQTSYHKKEVGNVVNPTQSAFLVTKNAAQENIAINSEVTVVWETEIKDQGGDFAANVFTAPVTGLYQLNLMLYMENLDTAATAYVARIVTSNRTYSCVMTPLMSADITVWSFVVSILADMEAGDTAYAVIRQNGGSAQADVNYGGSYFSGHLVC